MGSMQKQRHVEHLLEQIRDGVGDLERLRAHGIRGPALAERERAVDLARVELARTVASPRW